MRVYQVSREFYPFANAGGLKEVVTGVAVSLSQTGNSSSVFIPCYGFVDKGRDDLINKESFKIIVKSRSVDITTYFTRYKGVDVYMFDFPSIADKNDVYTYSLDDEKNNSIHKRGHGFYDTDRINIIFQLAFLEYASRFLETPDVISLHDGHTGLIPGIIKSNDKFKDKFKHSNIFFTIHNAGFAYHQRFLVEDLCGYNIIDDHLIGQATFGRDVDPLCMAVLNSTSLTVSPFYAKEILDLEHEESSDRFGYFCNTNSVNITGIINGVNIGHFGKLGIKGLPDKYIKNGYRIEIEHFIKQPHILKVWGGLCFEDRPLFIFQNRITEQKGIDQLISSIKKIILSGSDSYFIIMGQGEARYEHMLIDLSIDSPSHVCYIQGYDEIIANKLFLASDFFVLTSLWEPCGLTDFEAQLAGSIPIVHKTGGLQKVINDETGFVYSSFSDLVSTMCKCEELFLKKDIVLDKIKLNAFKLIKEKYTWNKVVLNEYLPLFRGKA